jgi:hypothetical protein
MPTQAIIRQTAKPIPPYRVRAGASFGETLGKEACCPTAVRPTHTRELARVAAGMFGVVTAQPVVPFLLSPENPAHRLGSNPQSPSQIVDAINDRDHTDSPIHPRHLDSHARNLTAQLLAEIHDQRCPRIQRVRRL